MNNKKLISLLLTFILIIFCTACSTDESSSSPTDDNEILTELPDIPDMITPGVYTFYNESTGCYLSYQDNSLILSDNPVNWNLKSYNENSFYIYACDTDLLLDIDNATIADGTTIKLWSLTGYDVQIWNITGNDNSTYSILYSGNNDYCLGLDNGSTILQLRDKNNPMQDWKVVKVTDSSSLGYYSLVSAGGVIELQLPLDIETVISKSRLQEWANDLETAYYSFYELTNFVPYKNIIVEAYNPCEYIGYVINDSNIIHIDCDFIYDDLAKMAARADDWNFCALHEMGHMFDCHRPWVFEAEVMTDLKVAYVLEMNNTSAVPSEFDASYSFYGEDIKNAYDTLVSDFSSTYNIFGCASRFLEIKEDIGWEPFKQTFHYLQENYDEYSNTSKQEMFENFIKLLSQYSGKDIKSYFSVNEWNTIIQKTYS